MKVLHGPLARNNKHVYLAYIEFLHGVDASAIALGDRASSNFHLSSPQFEDFLRTRVRFVPRRALGMATGLLGALGDVILRHEYDTLHLYSLYSYLPVPIDFQRGAWTQPYANLDMALMRQIDRWRGAQRSVYLHFQGCDLRTPAEYEGAFPAPETPCHFCSKRTTYCGDAYRVVRAERLRRLLDHSDGAFVATPDLLRLLPDASYLPQPFFFDEWSGPPAAVDKFADATEVRVVHAPSDPARKGTPAVEAAIDALVARGVPLAYQRLQGLPRSAMRPTLDAAHVLVDQLLVGYYGNALVEGVASGAHGVVNIKVPDDPVREHVSDATPATVEAVLREVSERVLDHDPALAGAAARARDFFVAKHGPAAIAAALRGAYDRTRAAATP